MSFLIDLLISFRLILVLICVICAMDLRPWSDILLWPFPSGTRGEGPAGRGEEGHSLGTRGTGASGLLWGSEVEASGSHLDWPAPPSPHCPLREVYQRRFLYDLWWCFAKSWFMQAHVGRSVPVPVCGSVRSKVWCGHTLLMTVQVNYLLQRDCHGIVPVYTERHDIKNKVSQIATQTKITS